MYSLMMAYAADTVAIEPGMKAELRAAAERVTAELAKKAAGKSAAPSVTVLQAAREVSFPTFISKSHTAYAG
jgi:hypothetical protein